MPNDFLRAASAPKTNGVRPLAVIPKATSESFTPRSSIAERAVASFIFGALHTSKKRGHLSRDEFLARVPAKRQMSAGFRSHREHRAGHLCPHRHINKRPPLRKATVDHFKSALASLSTCSTQRFPDKPLFLDKKLDQFLGAQLFQIFRARIPLLRQGDWRDLPIWSPASFDRNVVRLLELRSEPRGAQFWRLFSHGHARIGAGFFLSLRRKVCCVNRVAVKEAANEHHLGCEQMQAALATASVYSTQDARAPSSKISMTRSGSPFARCFTNHWSEHGNFHLVRDLCPAHELVEIIEAKVRAEYSRQIAPRRDANRIRAERAATLARK